MALKKKDDPKPREVFGFICFREGCGKALYCRGICKSHYNMLALQVKKRMTTWDDAMMQGLCRRAEERKRAAAQGQAW